LAGNPVSDKLMHHIFYAVWLKNSCAAHLHFNMELKKALREKKLEAKLKRFDHHKSHAVAAYYTSGFDKALVLTLDAYGSGLAGSVWLGEAGMVRKVAAFRYPNSLGLFYETLTSSLGFKPNRHEGKIVGLAAYGDPHILHDTVISRFRLKDGDFRYINGCNYLFLKNISTKFSKQNIASAYQSVLEEIMSGVTEYFSAKFGIENVAISGGVTANVKLNQRIFETKGIKNIFIFPDMGDGGTCVGGALMPFVEKGLKPYRLKDVYFGPEYSEPEMRKCLEEAGLNYERVDNIERRIAELLAQNKIVARFDGRMEFGPRALGNRSVMYQAKDPGINQWLNKQLGRTEFMPFAPVTLYEKRDMCYKNIEGAEYAAEFMTITCDCTSWMSKNCPAAVHVDNTARPQLIKRETNPGYYKILEEYYKLTGIPTVINTSFNMHEEPIVCTPFDAIRAFKLGKLHYMAMGNFLIQGE
ncbi:MAG: carbamoyltransferase, partial [Candidatus Omnitrophica bacterium]|nr:carbamoyltransferase [Candidatus Omnitrophota bacterium]